MYLAYTHHTCPQLLLVDIYIDRSPAHTGQMDSYRLKGKMLWEIWFISKVSNSHF